MPKFSLDNLRRARVVAEEARERAEEKEVTEHPFLRKTEEGDVVVSIVLGKLKERLRQTNPAALKNIEKQERRSMRTAELLRTFGPKILEVSRDPRTKRPNKQVQEVLALMEEALRVIDND